MSGQTGGLYRLRKQDVPRAGEVLVEAFGDDPVWSQVLRGAKAEQKQGMYQVPVRYCLRYGQAHAPSENLEGVITWVPGHLADMRIARLLLSGAIWSGLRVGTQLPAKLEAVSRLLARDRRENMKGRSFLYVPVLGVVPQLQRLGLGSKLLGALLAASEQAGTPIYLETESEGNVSWYKAFGFQVVKQITLPVMDLPMWEMVRTPG